MKILVVGSAGREHALCRKLYEDGAQVYSYMKNRNPGIISVSTKHAIGDELDHKSILKFAKTSDVDLVFVGPDPVLDSPLVDTLIREGIRVASPSRNAARIETSKEYMRDLLDRYSIGRKVMNRSFTDSDSLRRWIGDLDVDFVVKPVGLTGGKGVRVMGDHFDTAVTGLAIAESIMRKDGKVLIEEKLEGEEFSLQAFSDGSRVFPMPVAQDYKRAYEGDMGPNTGGMGSITDSDFGLPFIRRSTVETAINIVKDIAEALNRDGNPFRGILYAQFMATEKGPRIVEVNARFADPEGINVLAVMKSSLADMLSGIADGHVSKAPRFAHKATVLKYIVPKGYGSEPQLGYLNIPKGLENESRKVYYASVKGNLSTVEMTSSRAVALLGISGSIEESSAIVDSMVPEIRGDFYIRSDIGKREQLQAKVSKMIRIRN